MSKVKIQGNASGTGVVTLTAPNTNTDRTITLPDDTQTLIGTNASGNVGIGLSSPESLLHLSQPNTNEGQITLGGLYNGSEHNAGRIYFKHDSGWTTELRLGTADNHSSSYRDELIIKKGYVTMPNQPAFNAHNSAAIQTTGTIVWASTRSNIGNHYSTSTGNFTAPVAGTYSFSWQCYQNNNAVYSSITALKNGSDVYEGLIDGTSNSYNSIDGAITIYLSVNDTFRLDVRQGSIHTNPNYSFFSGHLIG